MLIPSESEIWHQSFLEWTYKTVVLFQPMRSYPPKWAVRYTLTLPWWRKNTSIYLGELLFINVNSATYPCSYYWSILLKLGIRERFQSQNIKPNFTKCSVCKEVENCTSHPLSLSSELERGGGEPGDSFSHLVLEQPSTHPLHSSVALVGSHSLCWTWCGDPVCYEAKPKGGPWHHSWGEEGLHWQ